jgi:hypothetical protein
MLAAGFAAMLTANLVRSPPIYDSLRQCLFKRAGS